MVRSHNPVHCHVCHSHRRGSRSRTCSLLDQNQARCQLRDTPIVGTPAYRERPRRDSNAPLRSCSPPHCQLCCGVRRGIKSPLIIVTGYPTVSITRSSSKGTYLSPHNWQLCLFSTYLYFVCAIDSQSFWLVSLGGISSGCSSRYF